MKSFLVYRNPEGCSSLSYKNGLLKFYFLKHSTLGKYQSAGQISTAVSGIIKFSHENDPPKLTWLVKDI